MTRALSVLAAIIVATIFNIVWDAVFGIPDVWNSEWWRGMLGTALIQAVYLTARGIDQ